MGGLSKACHQTIPGKPSQMCILAQEPQELQPHSQLVCTCHQDCVPKKERIECRTGAIHLETKVGDHDREVENIK